MTNFFSIEFLPVTLLAVFGGAIVLKFRSRLSQLLVGFFLVTCFALNLFTERQCDRGLTNYLMAISRGEAPCAAWNNADLQAAPRTVETERDNRIINGGTIDGFRMPLDLNNGQNIDEFVEALAKNENGRVSLDVMIYENSVNDTITSNFYAIQHPEGPEEMVSYGLCGGTSEYYCHVLVFTNQEVLRRYVERTSFNAVRISGFFHVGHFSEPRADINLTYRGFDGAVSKIFIRAVEP